jgi:uroporphyrinogen-III decarboxylase
MAQRIDAPLILHICGKTLDRMPYIAKTGMAAFHFDSRNDPEEAMDAVDGGIGLVGNINNPQTLYSRGPDEVRKEVYACLEAGVQMIAPECAIPLQTKLQNLLAIPDAVKNWSAERL